MKLIFFGLKKKKSHSHLSTINQQPYNNLEIWEEKHDAIK